MQARTFFAVLGAATIGLAFIGWLLSWPQTATLWVGGIITLAITART